MTSKWTGTTARERVEGGIGQLANLTSDGDLAFYCELRKYIGEGSSPVRVIKVTKQGRAYVCDHSNPKIKFTVPCRNIKFITI